MNNKLLLMTLMLSCEGHNPSIAPDSTWDDLGRTSVDPPTPGVLALTFDDGPSELTPHILAVLAKHRAPATFFVIGRNIPGNRAILALEQRLGHAIGNHSFFHEPQPTLTEAVFRQRTLAVKANIGDRDGGKLYYRFPYGAAGTEQLRWLADLDVRGKRYKPVGWNIDSLDWQFGVDYPKGPSASIESACADVPNPFQHDFVGWTQFAAREAEGGVILFHDVQAITRDALDEILTGFESPDAYWTSLPADLAALYRTYYACANVSPTTSFRFAALDEGPWPSLRDP